MKQRIISSLVGLAVLGVALAVISTPIFNIIIAAISLIALFEMLRATNCLNNKGMAALSFSLAIAVPFGRASFIREWAAQIIFVYFVLFFVLLIKYSHTVRVEQASMMFMFSVFIPLFFSCAVFMRDLYGTVEGSFYLLLALGSAWLCDTGAYFAGRKFGRHKLAPIVSPHKTVEGSIGGLFSGVIFMVVIALGFSAVMSLAGVPVKINFPMLVAVTPVFGILGMLGDLSASVIKRQFNVKDYGTIMPGHGGVMDRFDSVLFTLPTVFIFSRIIELLPRHLHLIVAG